MIETVKRFRGHNRRLPVGVRISRIIRAYWQVQYNELMKRFRQSGLDVMVNLRHWDEPMTDAVEPSLRKLAGNGANEFNRWLRGKSVRRWVEKEIRPAAPRPETGISDYASNAIRNMAIHLSQSTNQTTSRTANDALSALRRQLLRGMTRGETQDELTRRVYSIFHDPERARVIARTEASRALHLGQVDAARESDVVSAKKWLASSDACDVCLPLNGKEVGLDEPFTTIGHGHYARVMHPPAHPNCMCTATFVLGS